MTRYARRACDVRITPGSRHLGLAFSMSALCRYCCKSLFGVANENSQTGYLGGAMASHVRIGSPLLTHILFGLYLGLMLWGGCGCATGACAT